MLDGNDAVPFKMATDGALALKKTILANLRTGQWQPGQRLPTERDLGVSFGIARSTVRRVIGQLKERGLLRQVVGSGTYVVDDLDARLAGESPPVESNVSPAELMEARLLFEPPLVELVVRNATPADFVEMEKCCERAEQADTLEQFEYWDGALHRTIAAASHNNFMIGVFDAMNKVRERSDWGALKRKSVTPERRDAYQREHRAMVAALRDRDTDKARAIVVEHLVRVRRNLLGY